MLDAMGEQFGVRPKTLAADKGYDGGPFLLELEGRRVRPHVPTKDGPIGGAFAHKRKGQEAIEARRRMRRRERTKGYGISQRCRKKVEEVFGVAQDGRGALRNEAGGTVEDPPATATGGRGVQPAADPQTGRVKLAPTVRNQTLLDATDPSAP